MRNSIIWYKEATDYLRGGLLPHPPRANARRVTVDERGRSRKIGNGINSRQIGDGIDSLSIANLEVQMKIVLAILLIDIGIISMALTRRGELQVTVVVEVALKLL